MRLYIIRHADPDYANHTITPSGHLEAAALAERLKREGIESIYCSPLPRAIHTMQYTAELLKLTPDIQPWMKELEGWHALDRTGSRIAAWNTDGETVRHNRPFPQSDNWHDFGPFRDKDFRSRYDALTDHSDSFMESLGYRREDGKYKIIQRNERKIAVFCHLGFGMTWLSHLLELPLPLIWSGFWKAPSSVTTVLMDERSAEYAVPRCIGVGDVSHLYAANLPISSQGIVANFI
jgi:broad specificity phosphatase PhoE